MTSYEICRIYLNTQASTGKIDTSVTKFLICGYFFLRLLVKEVLLKVETVLGPSTTEKSRKYAQLTSNFRYLACYMYHTMIKEAEEGVLRAPDGSQVLPKNQYRMPRPSAEPIVASTRC